MDDVTMEERLRAALRHQADRAPGPQRVVANFEARTRALRQRRRLLAAAGGIAVASVVGVPVVAARSWQRSSRHARPGASVTPGGDASSYAPTWLPAGATEHGRWTQVHGRSAGAMNRAWRAAINGKQQEILVLAEPVEPNEGEPRGEAVDIDGSRGGMDVTSVDAKVRWRPAANLGLTVMVHAARGARPLDGAAAAYREIALQVARSVRPGRSTPVVSPVGFRWLPPGFSHFQTSVEGESSRRWDAYLNAIAADNESPSLFVALTTAKAQQRDGAVAITVRGRAGWYYPTHPTAGQSTDANMVSSYLEADIGAGLALRVSDTYQTSRGAVVPLDKAVLIKVADSLAIDDPPDVSWIGR